MLLFVAITGFVVLAGLATGEEILTGEFSRTFEEKEILEGDEICIRYSLGFSGFRPRLVQLVQEFPEGMSLPPAQMYRIISGRGLQPVGLAVYCRLPLLHCLQER